MVSAAELVEGDGMPPLLRFRYNSSHTSQPWDNQSRLGLKDKVSKQELSARFLRCLLLAEHGPNEVVQQ